MLSLLKLSRVNADLGFNYPHALRTDCAHSKINLENQIVNDINKRKTFILAGDSEHLDRMLDLFEREQLSQAIGANVLDAGWVVTPIPPPVSENSPFDRISASWQELLDRLLQQNYQLAYRNGNILTKIVNIGDRQLELLLQLDPLPSDELQLFVCIRPPHGQGYLPPGLEVKLMDEFEQTLLSKTASNQTNILDLTQGHEVLCELTDRLIISLRLGAESVMEHFPN
jgi:hypothetical protein